MENKVEGRISRKEIWVVEWNGGMDWKHFTRWGDAVKWAHSLFVWGYTDSRIYADSLG